MLWELYESFPIDGRSENEEVLMVFEVTRNRDAIRFHLKKMMEEWKKNGKLGGEALKPGEGGTVLAFRR
jgi:hypothetical protein